MTGALKSRHISEKNFADVRKHVIRKFGVFCLGSPASYLNPGWKGVDGSGKDAKEKLWNSYRVIRRFVHFATSRIKLIYDPRVPSSPRWMLGFCCSRSLHTCSRRSQSRKHAETQFREDKTLCKHATRWRGMRKILSAFVNCRRGFSNLPNIHFRTTRKVYLKICSNFDA